MLKSLILFNVFVTLVVVLDAKKKLPLPSAKPLLKKRQNETLPTLKKQQGETPPTIKKRQEKTPPSIKKHAEEEPSKIKKRQEKAAPTLKKQQKKGPATLNKRQGETPSKVPANLNKRQRETPSKAPASLNKRQGETPSEAPSTLKKQQGNSSATSKKRQDQPPSGEEDPTTPAPDTESDPTTPTPDTEEDPTTPTPDTEEDPTPSDPDEDPEAAPQGESESEREISSDGEEGSDGGSSSDDETTQGESENGEDDSEESEEKEEVDPNKALSKALYELKKQDCLPTPEIIELQPEMQVEKVCNLEKVLQVMNNYSTVDFELFKMSQNIINPSNFMLGLGSKVVVSATKGSVKFDLVTSVQSEANPPPIANGLKLRFSYFAMEISFMDNCIHVTDFKSEGMIGQEYCTASIANHSYCPDKGFKETKMGIKFSRDINAEKIAKSLSKDQNVEFPIVQPAFNDSIEIRSNRTIDLILYDVTPMFEFVIPQSAMTEQSLGDIKGLVTYKNNTCVAVCSTSLYDMAKVTCSILGEVETMAKVETIMFAKISPRKFENLDLIKAMSKSSTIRFQSSVTDVIGTTLKNVQKEQMYTTTVKNNNGQEKRDETETTEDNTRARYTFPIIKGNCIRYSIVEKDFEELGINENTDKILVDMCMERNKITIKTTPEIKGNGTQIAKLFKTFTATGDNKGLHAELQRYANISFVLQSIVIDKIDVTGLKITVDLKFDGPYPIIPGLMNLTYTNLPISQDLTSNKITYESSGNEKFLDSITKVNIKTTKDSKWGVYTKLPVSSFKDLKSKLKINYLPEGYLESFSNLPRMYIKNCTIDTVFDCPFAFINGQVKLNEQNATIQMIYKPVNKTTEIAPASIFIEQSMLFKERCDQTSLQHAEELSEEGEEDEDEGGIVDIVKGTERGGSLKWQYHFLFAGCRNERYRGFLRQFRKINMGMQFKRDFLSDATFVKKKDRIPKGQYLEEKIKSLRDKFRHPQTVDTDVTTHCDTTGTPKTCMFNGDIHIHSMDLDVTGRNLRTENSKKHNRFLRKLLQVPNGDNFFDCDYYGTVSKNKVELISEFVKDIKLATGIRVANPRHHIFESIDETNCQSTEIQDTITGLLDIDNLPKSCAVPVKIDIMGNLIQFTFDDYDTINKKITLMHAPFVRETMIRSLKSPIEENSDYIILQSDLEIGLKHNKHLDGKSNVLTFKGTAESTEQYVYGNVSRNKFWACKNYTEKFTVREILKAFMYHDSLPITLFDGFQLSGLCVSYHNEDSGRWNIRSDFKPLTGLWIKAYWDFPEIQPNLTELCNKPESETKPDKMVKLPVYIHINGNELIFTAQMPPLYYADYVKNKTECKVESNIKITKSCDDQNEGPVLNMIYRLDTGFRAGYIQGCYITPLFKSLGRFVMKDLDPKTCIIKDHDPHAVMFRMMDKVKDEWHIDVLDADEPTFDNMKIQNMVELSIKGDFNEEQYRNSKFQCKMKLNHNNTAVNEAISKEFVKRAKFYEQLQNEMSGLSFRMERVFENATVHIMNKAEQMEFEMRKKRSEIEELHEVTKRTCGNNCNSVSLPGFKWNNNCQYSRSLGNMTCLQYTDKAYMASDVDCLLKCENKRKLSNDHMTSKRGIAALNYTSLLAEHAKNIIYKSLMYKLEGVYPTNLSKACMDGRAMEPVSVTVENDDAVFVAETDWSDCRNLRSAGCNKYKVKYNHREMNATFCCDKTIYDQVGKVIFRKANEGPFKQFMNMYDNCMSMADDMNFTIKGWQNDNKKALDTASQNKTVTVKRNSQKKSMSDYIPNTGGFNEDPFETNLLLDNYSPWHMVKKSDPLANIPTVQRKQVAAATASDPPCVTTRNKVEDFQSMIDYMKSWTDSFGKGYASMVNYQKNVKKGIRKLQKKIVKRAVIENTVTKESKAMNKWIKKAKKGYKTWIKESSRQLEALNMYGPQLIKTTLQQALTPAQSLESYIYQSSQQADEVFRKAFVAKDKPFENVAMTVINLWRSNNTLLQMAPTLDHILTQVGTLDKRTISCKRSNI